jgi:hypothetical protein
VSPRHLKMTPKEVINSTNIDSNFITMLVKEEDNDGVVASAKAKLTSGNVGSMNISFIKEKAIELSEKFEIDSTQSTIDVFREYIEVIDIPETVDSEDLLEVINDIATTIE